jgi:hypothetical protein
VVLIKYRMANSRNLSNVCGQEAADSTTWHGSKRKKSAILVKMWLGKMLEGLGNPFPKELADKAPAPSGTPGTANAQ